jgi:hypothetical protein
MERLGGGKFDMVAMLEIAFLIVCLVLGSWWFTHTNMFRAHRRSGIHPGQGGFYGDGTKWHGVGGPSGRDKRYSPRD